MFKDEPDIALRQVEAPVPSPVSVSPKELTYHRRPWKCQESVYCKKQKHIHVFLHC